MYHDTVCVEFLLHLVVHNWWFFMIKMYFGKTLLIIGELKIDGRGMRCCRNALRGLYGHFLCLMFDNCNRF